MENTLLPNVTDAVIDINEDLHIISHMLFASLSCICVLIYVWSQQTKEQLSSANNPQFIQFQRQFFLAYFLAVFSDWLQGPYVYKLYSHYGFAQSQIAVLYVVGFGASVLFGTSTGILADRFGRKKMCVVFSIVYSLCCVTKLSRNFNVLVIGRICGGIATSMLFSTFESWYVYEHVQRHDFPTEWLPVSFSKITFWKGILAITAGITANFSADELQLGPVAPFILAIPCLIAGGTIIWHTWPENYGNINSMFCKSCNEGLRLIIFDEKVLLLGAIQSLFESVMYIFVFLWTPVLDPLNPPLGIVFSCFMVCIMIGSSLYQILTSKGFKSCQVLAIAVGLSLGSMGVCVFSSNAFNPRPLLSLASFLMLELSVGLYFPAIGFLRSKIIPESYRASIMNWFSVPMNVITCCGLLWFHHEDNEHGNQSAFIICACLMSIALCLIKYFNHKVRNDDLIFK